MSTRRAEFRTALFGCLEDFKAANPTIIRQTYRARPATFKPPLGFVGLVREPSITIVQGSQVLRPAILSSLIIIVGAYENAETADKLDEAGETLLAYLVTQHARVSGSTLFEPTTGPEDVSLPIGETPYAGIEIAVRLNVVD